MFTYLKIYIFFEFLWYLKLSRLVSHSIISGTLYVSLYTKPNPRYLIHQSRSMLFTFFGVYLKNNFTSLWDAFLYLSAFEGVSRHGRAFARISKIQVSNSFLIESIENKVPCCPYFMLTQLMTLLYFEFQEFLYPFLKYRLEYPFW